MATERLKATDLGRLVVLLEETRHIIQFSDRGWMIAHPIRERLDLDTLFDCTIEPIWRAVVAQELGRFWLNDDGTIGPAYGGGS